jgi:hypothetical protein
MRHALRFPDGELGNRCSPSLPAFKGRLPKNGVWPPAEHLTSRSKP